MTLVVSTDLPFSSITIPNTPRKAHLLYNNLKPENLPPDFEEPWRHRDSINLAATTIISLLDDDFAKLPAVKEVIHLHWRVICKWAAAIVTYCVWIDEHSPENKMVSHFMALEYTFVFTVKDLVVLMNEELVDGMAKIWTSALDPNFRRSLLEFPQLESVYLSCLETVMSPGHAMAQTIPHVRLREAVRLDPSTYKNAGVANLRSAVQAATAKWDQGDSSLRTPQMFTCLFTLGLMHSFFCNPEISPVAWTPAQNFQVSADVIKLLAKVLDQPVKSNLATLEKMQPYVETCLNGLIMVSTVSEGRAWLVQAIRLDLLLLIAKLLLWLDNAAMLDVENHVEIITLLRTYIESLIPYLIFAPVIRAIPSRVAQFGEQPTTGSNHLVLCRLQWTIVQSMSAEDLRLLQGVELRCTNANVSAFKFATPSSRSFNLSQCANAPSRAALKQCNGCRRAYYCSLGCQKFDWKHGDHRRECSHIQRKRISLYL